MSKTQNLRKFKIKFTMKNCYCKTKLRELNEFVDYLSNNKKVGSEILFLIRRDIMKNACTCKALVKIYEKLVETLEKI